MYFKTMEVFWVQFSGFAIATIIVYTTGFYYTQIHSPVDTVFSKICHDHITLYKVIGDLLTRARFKTNRYKTYSWILFDLQITAS